MLGKDWMRQATTGSLSAPPSCQTAQHPRGLCPKGIHKRAATPGHHVSGVNQRCGSVVGHLPSMCQGQGLILDMAKPKQNPGVPNKKPRQFLKGHSATETPPSSALLTLPTPQPQTQSFCTNGPKYQSPFTGTAQAMRGTGCLGAVRNTRKSQGEGGATERAPHWCKVQDPASQNISTAAPCKILPGFQGMQAPNRPGPT